MADTLTPTQVAAYAYFVGFPEDQLANAVATAGGESSLDPTNTNPSGAKGLFQILEPAHPEFKEAWAKQGTVLGWDDPLTNTAMAYMVWKAKDGGSWSPWQAYGGTQYKAYLPAATAAQQEVQSKISSLGEKGAKAWAFSQFTPNDQKNWGQFKNDLGAVAGAVAGAGNELGSTVSAAGPALGSAVGDLTANFANLSTLFGNLLLPTFWLRVLCAVLGLGSLVGGVLLLGKEAKASG